MLSTEPVFSTVSLSARAAVSFTVLDSSIATDVYGGCEIKMYPKKHIYVKVRASARSTTQESCILKDKMFIVKRKWRLLFMEKNI